MYSYAQEHAGAELHKHCHKKLCPVRAHTLHLHDSQRKNVHIPARVGTGVPN